MLQSLERQFPKDYFGTRCIAPEKDLLQFAEHLSNYWLFVRINLSSLSS